MTGTNISMPLLRETWLLTFAQLHYRLSSLLLVLMIEIGGVSFFSMLADSGDRKVVIPLLTALLGFVLGIFGLGVDAFERRIRLLVILPASRAAVALSRLLGVLVMQAAISFIAWMLCQLFALFGRGAAPSAELFALAALWAVTLVYSTIVFEEVNVALSASKLMVYAVNIGFAVAVAAITVIVSDLDTVLRDGGLLLACGSMVGMGALAVLMFRVRRTLDVGINPWHGLPTDWSGG